MPSTPAMSSRTRVVVAAFTTMFVIGAMVGYGVVRLRHWHHRGIAGIGFFPAVTEKQTKFLGIEPGSVFMLYPTAPATRSIKPRDVVLSIDGIPIRAAARLEALNRTARTGDTITYRVRRGNATLDIPVRLASPLRTPLFLVSCVVTSFGAAAFIAIGLLVLAKQSGDRRATVFYAMVMVGAMSLLGQPWLALDASNIRGILGQSSSSSLLPLVMLLGTAMAFLPLTLHLALVFPRDRPILRSSPRVLRWIYGLPAMLLAAMMLLSAIGVLASGKARPPRGLDLGLNIFSAVLTLAGLVIALRIARRGREEGLLRAFWNRPLQTLLVGAAVMLGFARIADALEMKLLAVASVVVLGIVPVLALFAFPVFACVSLYRSYREAGTEERRQVKWPLWGTLIAIGTRLAMTLAVQIGGMAIMVAHADVAPFMATAHVIDTLSTLLYLLIPISFAVAILKYRLMNIDLIIRKTVVYAFLSTVIICLYLVLVGGLGTLLVEVAGLRNQTMVIASTLVVALLVVPLRNKLQTVVDRNLFRHRYDYPAALKAISGVTVTAADLGSFLGSAAEKTQQALQNRAVVIFVTRNEELVAAAKVGVADSVLGTLRFARTPMLPLLDRPFDPRHLSLPEDAAAALRHIEAVLVVPINTPGTSANGFLALASKLSGGAFEEEDVDFLRSVADQLDVGIDRIRLQREEADYEQARAIQQTLLPREMPRVAGLDVSGLWQPARAMGGDYYDLLKLGPTELAVCIGDVAGKGMPAALLMSGLQAAVRASASSSPRDLCERVRRVVVSTLSGGRFVTFFYATLDTAAMRLRWCNAGHNAPVLVRADGSSVRLAEGGPAFTRLFRDDEYEEREIAIAPGDRLVLFTDGVSEAVGADGDLFGEPRIEEVVVEHRSRGARELQEILVDAATRFTGGELEDDLTLVVVAISAAE